MARHLKNIDENRRKFLKHLTLIGIGGAVGMSLAGLTAPSKTEIRDEYAEDEIKRDRKLVFTLDPSYHDYVLGNSSVPPSGDPRGEKDTEFKSGGWPYINEAACAYHYDDDGDGIYEDKEKGKYCTSPCIRICPVNALERHSAGKEDIEEGEKVVPGFPSKRGKSKNPLLNFGMDSKCIHCGLCYKVCGYDAIMWVNTIPGAK